MVTLLCHRSDTREALKSSLMASPEIGKKEIMMLPLRTKPYALNHEQGLGLRSRGTLVLVKASTDQTGGVFNLFEVACPPGYTTSLDIHYAEDVAVYVLEGTLTFFWGNEKEMAIAGSYFYQPRGTPYGFRVEGSTPARILYLSFPAGLDRFVVEQGMLAPNSDSGMAAARHKIETLGPLPE